HVTGAQTCALRIFGNSQNLSNIHNFIARIIVSEDLTADQIKSWRIRDKYYVLFEAIRLTYGDTLTFDHTFMDKSTHTQEQDLTELTWDFTRPISEYPKKGDKGYNPERVKPYPDTNTKVEFKLTSGKIVGFEYLTGDLEDIALLADPNDRQINDELRNRNFYILQGENPFKPTNFAMFKATEMREIRKKLIEHDQEWMAMITVEHPKNHLKNEMICLFKLRDFLFPGLT